MTEPGATYRLQLREGVGFEEAAALTPYLKALGISHLYLSPAFEAAPGSTHGYDATRFDRLDPELGGDAGFDRLCGALKDHGLGMILDFVPNHVAASPFNPWWCSVLEWGEQSAYARHFDIDWSAGKLLLPVLGAPYGAALEDGAFSASFNAKDGSFLLRVYDSVLPLTPPTYATLLAGLEAEPFPALARQFAACGPETAGELKDALREAAESKKNRSAIEAACKEISDDRERLHALHEAQNFRLAFWRAARERLTYRRFFEISDLAGIRVEDPGIFAEVHARLLDLVADGCVDGIRLDHIDGLAFPKIYLDRLQDALSETTGQQGPFYLTVEKILGPGEALREDWPVAGTTGYEFITALADLFVAPNGAAPLLAAYEAFIGQETDYEALVQKTKRRILTRNLAAELDRLTHEAESLAAAHPMTRDWGTDTLRRAIIEIAAALPVYRTYVDPAGASDEDRRVIADAAAAAKATREVEDEAAIDFIARVLTLDFETPEEQAAALAITARFQQTTGPVMAKALEDTVFYRFNRLIALDEVGGEPDHFGAPAEAFAEAMQARLREQPLGLSATATHDTKRGEDARARLYAISEDPNRWASDVERWSAMNARFGTEADEGETFDRNTEWLFYQALAGAWPLDLAPDDKTGLVELAGRMAAFMTKAIREAKALTSWTAPDEAYEAAVEGFVAAVLDRSNAAFLDDFYANCQWLFRAGIVTGLSQLAIKLTAPGVPDIYQGTEFWDFSLVDPDNRRPVAFEARRERLETMSDRSAQDLLGGWEQGEPKLHLLRAGLALRSEGADLFRDGEFVWLYAEGECADHVVAFARKDGDAFCLTVTPRHVVPLLEGSEGWTIAAERWSDTTIPIPEWARGTRVRDALSGKEMELGKDLAVGELLSDFPVALLMTV